MARGTNADRSVLWRPAVDGVEVLHAHFYRHEYPRHAHESTTVALMDSGAATFWYRGENFVAPARSAFLINADAVHTGRLADPEGYRYRVLYLDAVALRPLLAPDSVGPSVLSFRETVVHDPLVAMLLHRTHCALTDAQLPLLQEELLLQVSRILLRRYGDFRVRSSSITAPESRAVSTARDYLESHPADKVSLQDLALVAASSPYRLVRMFSNEVGMPPHAYQIQLRVRLARRLLATGAPAASVAIQVGFCDQAHLSRVFKKHTGITPGQFSRSVHVRHR